MYTYASKYNSWKQGAVHGKLKATLTIEWNEITNKWNKQKKQMTFSLRILKYEKQPSYTRD